MTWATRRVHAAGRIRRRTAGALCLLCAAAAALLSPRPASSAAAAQPGVAYLSPAEFVLQANDSAGAAAGSAAYLESPDLVVSYPEDATVYMCGNVTAYEVLFEREQGIVIMGILDGLLSALQAAYCSVAFGSAYYECAGYQSATLQLWTTLGQTYLCGFDTATWLGPPVARLHRLTPAAAAAAAPALRAPVRHHQVSNFPPEKVLEYLLGQCSETPQQGALLSAVQSTSALFLSAVTLERADVQVVVAYNNEAAGRPAATGLNDLSGASALFPPIIPELAPVPVLERQPAVVTADTPTDAWQDIPSNPAGVRASSPRGLLAAVARQGLGPYPSLVYSTAQYPDDLASAIEDGPYAEGLYSQEYLLQPSPQAHYRTDYCSQRPYDDPQCFPYVVPQVGYTHDALGNPLLSDRGQPLPPGTPNAAGVVPQQ